MKPHATRIAVLCRKVVTAEEAVQKELKRTYPEGTRVLVKLNCNQRTPTEAEVIGHVGGRYARLRVRCLSSRTPFVRDVACGDYEAA